MIHFITTLLALGLGSSSAQAGLQHVEPAFWWTGMQESRLQILVHGPSIGLCQPELEYPGVTLQECVRTENPNYLFLYLDISPAAQPGTFPIQFLLGGQVAETYTYELKERRPGSAARLGCDPADVIYLITPDRFANGDPTNDAVPDLQETTVDRAAPYGRHGGDLQGVIDRLDYLQSMGFTALWLNPVLENNQPGQSYHGYAITDFYRVDPRFGTLEDYRRLADEAARRGLQLVLDVILNHCGSGHWWMQDLPSRDWINYHPDFRITNHFRTTHQDPHAAPEDAALMVGGWFVEAMPDLNVTHRLLGDYLIQNSLWWVEYLDLGGLRIDTYPYPDKDFSARWSRRMLQEYPHLYLVGEEWSLNPAIVSYWQKGKVNHDGYRSHLPSVFDFPLQNALVRAFAEKEAWDGGFVHLYTALANDFLYPEPHQLTVFLGNHDMNRYFMDLGQDVALARNAMVWLATVRGIPQFFYGDEILMTHLESNGHGHIRKDFPGGWAGDPVNGFTGENLPPEAREFQAFVRHLLRWRQEQKAIHQGRLTHYSPEREKGTYCYFRYNRQQTVMVVLNRHPEPAQLPLDRFQRFVRPGIEVRDILRNTTMTLPDTLLLAPKTPVLLEFPTLPTAISIHD